MVKKIAYLGFGMANGYLVTLACILSIQYIITVFSPQSMRIDYERVEPVKDVFCLGETPTFKSYSALKRVPTYIQWNDTQLCDIDSRTDDDYMAYYNNAVTSIYATTPYDRLVPGRLRHYNNDGLKEPGTCFMQHEITILADFGLKKTQVIKGENYRYEDCTSVYTGELQGE